MVDENAIYVGCECRCEYGRYINIKLDKIKEGHDYEVWFNDAWHKFSVKKDRIYIKLGRII